MIKWGIIMWGPAIVWAVVFVSFVYFIYLVATDQIGLDE